MSEEQYRNDGKSFELGMEMIQELGDLGKTVVESSFHAAENFGNGLFTAMDNAGARRHERNMQKLQNKLKEMENVHEEKMQRQRNAHEMEMLKEQNRHDEYVISEQRKVIEKMIEAASAAYDKKLDFYNAQLDCLESTYSRESELISEHIRFLEEERSKNINDAEKYILLSNNIDKREEEKSKLYVEYMTAQGNLNAAIKCLEINKDFNSLEQAQTKLLG